MDTTDSKILVADDDRIVVAKLSGLGYEVTEVPDGQEALRLLEEGTSLVSDSLMPRTNGLELVRGIRSIMLTSRQDERDIIEGLDDYVTKPFSPDELAARVRTVLWRTRRDHAG